MPQEVTAQRLAVLLDDPQNRSQLKVEVPGSTISANAGYQSLRQYQMQPTAKPQFYALPQVGARWLMVRITAAGEHASLKELAVYGHVGPPRTRYEFKESPAAALNVLAGIKSQVKSAITPEEQALFDDAKGRSPGFPDAINPSPEGPRGRPKWTSH